MIWNLLLLTLLLLATVISSLALLSGSGHPRRRPH